MKIKEIIALICVITLSVAMGAGLALGVASTFAKPQPQAPKTLGSSSDNVLATYPSVSRVFVNAADTLVIGTSTGRTYLVINNISGATTTPQVVSCNFGDR